MEGITNVKPSSHNKRGLGFTFLGMQVKDSEGSTQTIDMDFVSREEFEKEIAVLRSIVESSWSYRIKHWFKKPQQSPLHLL